VKLISIIPIYLDWEGADAQSATAALGCWRNTVAMWLLLSTHTTVEIGSLFLRHKKFGVSGHKVFMKVASRRCEEGVNDEAE
jgi:hypothetical protein